MTATTSLENLHDIVAPAPPPWLPPAPGWYALGLTLLLLLCWRGVSGYRRWQRNHYRRQALAELDRLEQALGRDDTPEQLLPQLPVLIKRAALAAYGRERVASLYGKAWLSFLDRAVSEALFDNASGQLLLRCAYARPAELAQLDQGAVQTLFGVARVWLARHRLSLED